MRLSDLWKNRAEPTKNLAGKPPDPRVVAEQLLAEVLPQDQYLSLAALGSCEVSAKINKKYVLYRNSKTQIQSEQGDWFSSCIHLTENAPDADRIVAEYLLIRNDEQQYLKIANLSLISRPDNALDALDPFLWGQAVVGGRGMGQISYMTTSCGFFRR